MSKPTGHRPFPVLPRLRPGLRRAVLALCALAVLAAPADAADVVTPEVPATAAPMAARPPVRVTMDDNYPPFSFRDAHGTHMGLVRDLWKLWSQRTGVPVEFLATDWALARNLIETGGADVIETFFRSPARDRVYSFSEPYATIDVPIWFNADLGGITGPDSLRGYNVGVKERDLCADWLADRGLTGLRNFPSYEALLDAAAARDVVVFCMDDQAARYFMTKRGIQDRFRYTDPLYTGKLHWAVRKEETALLALVADGFARVTPDERRAIEERWYGRRISGVVDSNLLSRLVKILLGALALGAMALVWAAMLRRQVAAKTERLSEAMAALSIGEERFRTIFDNVNDAIFIHDLDTATIIHANRRMHEMYRIGDLPLAALDIGMISSGVPPYTMEDAVAWVRRAAAGETPLFEWHARRLDGSLFWVEVNIRRALLEGSDRRLLVVVRDITERRATQERMDFLAQHDPLTLLPNRLLVRDRADQAVAHAERDGVIVALLVCDLDQFKTVNDSLGHAAGDALLRAVAGRLTACVCDTDTVSRPGGDEFILLLSGRPDTDAVVETVASLHEALAEPFDVDGTEVTVTLSTGIALAPADGRDFAALMKNADTAMHHAKASGRNTHRFFAEAMNAEAVAHLSIRGGLRRALERGEFLIHYQPQVNLDSGMVFGAEALIRWNHPERGMIPPGAFIPIAEDSGLIVPIGDWVLREACRQAAQWQAAGLPLTVAVNLSARQLQRPDLARTVTDALTDSGLDPLFLELELTESMLIQNTDAVLENIRRVKALGVQLSIDDFGTGYSNLSYIGRLAVDKLKIDRSFIMDLCRNHDSARITAAVIQMAHSLNLTAVAEGVEDAETLEQLRQLRCDVAQGYFLGRPGPAEAVERAARQANPFHIGA
ncbi:EAL domain-containing protein [Azospirillum doebereinerae]|uniref:EAL domain-containing protein n=1 Tax=Azospirillum doebereinerae TaxID=92933 RepID=A0A433JC22_9PROT|nr:EAL domain-containing protein [Azospirillum doebereinerae]MCG5239342.1 EAL domain-containing protein [Azospirillum doebereinerae]RUQ74031.1 EAL domain-containing protein [Azospirillum doebereinerae]